MNLDQSYVLFTTNWLDLIRDGKAYLLTDFNRIIRSYGFIMYYSELTNSYVKPNYNNIALVDLIFGLTNIVNYLNNNKVPWQPGKCPFTKDDKFGFIIVKLDYLIVVTIDNSGSTNTVEYPLLNTNKIK